MPQKRWVVGYTGTSPFGTIDDILAVLLDNRGQETKEQIEKFLLVPDPSGLTAEDVAIDARQLETALTRIAVAIRNHESIVVYADYDADGVTSGAIMWETIHQLGGTVMPYIPHRVDEGYGLSAKGIDAVIDQYHPKLIITVDHGITAKEKVAYAKGKGIDVIITDHHVKPDNLPDCPIVHTTMLCGAGVAWMVAKGLRQKITGTLGHPVSDDHIALAAIGTIADMVPLTGPNRSIVRYGLAKINSTERLGILALMKESGLESGSIGPYEVSHILAPRLNAMGRLVHAMDALRLLCTKKLDKAEELASTLGATNKERQQMTLDTTLHAIDGIKQLGDHGKKILFVSSDLYNPGVIGLVAGKLVEEYYLPSIVVSVSGMYSKASARSISGFNIVEAIRTAADLLVDVGGHPMAAGFTVETSKLPQLRERLEELAKRELDSEKLIRVQKIDCEIPLSLVTEELWQRIQSFQPFGFGNTEPVFMTGNVRVTDKRTVGADGKHLKMKVASTASIDRLSGLSALDCIGFGLGEWDKRIRVGDTVNIAYSIDMNEWNGRRTVQAKLKDIGNLQ